MIAMKNRFRIEYIFGILVILLVVCSCELHEGVTNKEILLTSPEKILPASGINLPNTVISEKTSYGRRANHASVVFDNKMWVIAGHGRISDTIFFEDRNDIWCSTDGKNWQEVNSKAAFEQRGGHAMTVANNSMWIVGGKRSPSGGGQYFNDVWRSKNGKDWVQTVKNAPFSARRHHTLTNLNGRMFLIGGFSNPLDEEDWVKGDIWVSSDSVQWDQVTKLAPFGRRHGHATVVYNNRIWVIGGYDNYGNYLNDVWYSKNGYQWNLATPNAQFSRRRLHEVVANEKGMWLTGGSSKGSSYHNDIWFSKDGIAWESVNVIKFFPARGYHTSLYFDDRLWVLNGYYDVADEEGYYNAVYFRDIWGYR